MRVVLGSFDDVWVQGIGDPGMPLHVVAVAARGRELGLSLEKLPALAHTQERYLAAPDRVRIGALRLEPRELAGTLAREARRLAAARLKR
jgi:hypothetical protein